MMWLIEDKNLVGFDIFFFKIRALAYIYVFQSKGRAHTHTPREREREVAKERVLLAKNGNSDKSQDV